jgi:hypothetical protein
MRAFASALWALVLIVGLASCGGGGGGSSDSPAIPLLSFVPGTVTANVASGNSATVTVRATANDTSVFSSQLYVYVVDSQHVLTSSVELAQVDSRTMSATVHTLPTLAAGRYTGTFQVQLCNDVNCASPVRGSPVPLPYDITISAAPLSAFAQTSTAATVHHGAPAATPVNVSVGATGLSWTASTTAAWLQVNNGTGTGSGAFSVSYVTSTLAEGAYSSTVTVKSVDGQTVTLPFTLDVLPTQFVLSSGVPTFNAVNGAPIASQAVSFALDNGVATPWTATSSAPWMVADPLLGTTPATVSLRPDPTRGPLASGSYSSDLVLSSAGIANKTVTSQLTLTKPNLSAATASVTLGGDRGRDLTSAQLVSVSLNTGSNAWPYAISGLPGWLSSSTLTGSVNQAGTMLSLSPRPSGVTPGSASANVSITATVNGDTVVLPLTVNMNADQRRLLSSEWGVSFSSSPTGTVLSRTLAISDNFDGALAWTASSDSSWLAVTASGTTGTTTLTLTANPAALTAETLSVAKVTVTPATAGVASAVIRVALWKSASGLAAITKLPQDYSEIVADRTRPYVYVHNRATTIDVYNAYTAQKVTTITGVGAALGQMSVSPDGQKLYALDTAARSMAVVDLATMTKSATWALDRAVDHSTSVLAVRPNGVDVVLVGDGTAYESGRSLGSSGIFGQLVGTADGQSVFSLGARYSVDYSAMSGGVLFTKLINYVNGNSGGNLRDVAINMDGSRAYEASGGGVSSGGYRCASIDGATGSYIGALPGGDAYPNNVEVTVDGRPICGIFGWYSVADFWVHSPAGALIQGYKFAGYARAMKDGRMVVTPDGFVVVALTDDPLIAFVPIGGP